MLPEPSEAAASSSEVFIWLTFDAIERNEKGMNPIVMAITIRKAEFVNLSFDAAMDIASPNNVPGIAAGNCARTSKYCFKGDLVL